MCAWTIVHQLPGRLRLRSATARSGATLPWAVETLLAQPGVQAVTPNAKTGSLLVLFDGKQTKATDVMDCLQSSPSTLSPTQKRPVLPSTKRKQPDPLEGTLQVFGLIALIFAHHKLFRLRPMNLLWWAMIAYLWKKHLPIMRAKWRRISARQPQ
ncbi:hypothetical protein GTO89_00480 [Heliobacterium gestii]|uniref:HMA domain-containing protein n=1 Tax=Heliomicrobium gestii TaxID=2699 RepID=A0A845L5L9_HELGE|nr:hypothetical protein [Heliomicrobium gestii]MBM7865243.1 hypothetical protein [Heliomicrobium gestii]MZP41508.1 hypothetical protein [Heliomicrobium gestii]